MFDAHWKALPEDKKEVYHSLSALILSDASCHNSNPSHRRRLFKYVTIAFVVHDNHLMPRSTDSEVGPELASLMFGWVCSERGGPAG